MTSSCAFGFGQWAAEKAAARGDVIVIVDVLSFTTSVTIAVDRGALIYPCRDSDDLPALTARIGGEAAVARADVPAKGRFSLSPQTYVAIEPETRVAVWSPNGATCSRCAVTAPYVLAGALVNAEAIGATVNKILANSDLAVTVIACGERETGPDGKTYLRWAEEDILGAGAVMSYVEGDKSPAACLVEKAFRQCRDRLDDVLRQCESGRYLINRGFDGDVGIAAHLNRYQIAPILRDGSFRPFTR